MPEAVEGPYLNMPPNVIQRIHEARHLKESHEEEKPFPQVIEKEAKKDKEEEQEDEKAKKQDLYDKESDVGDTESKAVVIQNHPESASVEGPGLVIDITV